MLSEIDGRGVWSLLKESKVKEKYLPRGEIK